MAIFEIRWQVLTRAVDPPTLELATAQGDITTLRPDQEHAEGQRTGNHRGPGDWLGTMRRPDASTMTS